MNGGNYVFSLLFFFPGDADNAARLCLLCAALGVDQSLTKLLYI